MKMFRVMAAFALLLGCIAFTTACDKKGAQEAGTPATTTATPAATDSATTATAP